MSKDQLTLSPSFNEQPFIRAFETPDDIGALLRVHFQLDVALDSAIETFVPNPKELRLRYTGQKIKFLKAFGIPDVRRRPAEVINAIRNKFAHDGVEQFDVSDIKKLRHAVNTLFAGRMTDDFSFAFSYEDESKKIRYKEMSTKEKFVVFGANAVAAISVIPDEFTKALKQTDLD